MNNILKAQESLYIWLASFEKRSYDMIRQSCDYLNVQYDLGIENNAVWKIFYPLVYSGVVDHIGKGYFALTEPMAIDFNTHYVLINCKNSTSSKKTECIGISLFGKDKEIYITQNIVKFHALQLLKSFPSISSIVEGFYESLVEEDKFEYHNYKTKKGVAEIKEGGLKRYFSVPQDGYQRQIPDKATNPDALNISYYYERVVNKQYNGHYKIKTNDLYLESFGLPILVHRVLMLDCLSRKIMPQKNNTEYHYSGVQHKIVKELNRILNNSIKIDE